MGCCCKYLQGPTETGLRTPPIETGLLLILLILTVVPDRRTRKNPCAGGRWHADTIPSANSHRHNYHPMAPRGASTTFPAPRPRDQICMTMRRRKRATSTPTSTLQTSDSTARTPTPSPSPRTNTAGERFLVSHALQREALLQCQPAQPLLARHQEQVDEAQSRWLAHPLRTERLAWS